VNCQTGETFARTETEAENRNEIVKVLGVAGNELRRKLGEPQASLQKFNEPLDEAASASLEALQAYAQGVETHIESGDFQAVRFFVRAVELDPNFAQAYGYLGMLYENLLENSLAIQTLNRAYELRNRVTKRERFMIEAAYYAIATGELEKSIPTLTEWIQSYPRDQMPPNVLSSVYILLGQYPKAAAQARESQRMLPHHYAVIGNLMTADIAMNHLAEAKTVSEEVRSHNLEASELSLNRYLLAFLQGDRVAMEEQAKFAMGKPGVENLLLSAQSDTEAYHGRFARARDFSQRAIESARHAGVPETAATWRANQALREALIGNPDRARKNAAEALELSHGTAVKAVVAFALAVAGDTGQAENLARELNRDRPLDIMIQNYWLPSIRAVIELHKNNPRKAIDILQVATPYELGSNEYSGDLHPVYVRGLAYLQAGQGQLAATEYQKMIDHPGVICNFVSGALAHFQLGRAQAMMGDKEAARKSYQGFLTLWKDADPDVPIYRQAKAEYARLR